MKIENREKIDFQELLKIDALDNTKWMKGGGVGKGGVLEELVIEKLYTRVLISIINKTD